MSRLRWVRILGDGCVYSGPCRVYMVVLQVEAANDYANIYDGIDPTSGKLFVKLTSAVKVTWALDLNSGVPFVSGIYIDATDSAVATTVVFEPIDED